MSTSIIRKNKIQSFSKQDAEKLGLKKAIILQVMRDILYYQDRTVCSVFEIEEKVPYLKPSLIKNKLLELEALGILVSIDGKDGYSFAEDSL